MNKKVKLIAAFLAENETFADRFRIYNASRNLDYKVALFFEKIAPSIISN